MGNKHTVTDPVKYDAPFQFPQLLKMMSHLGYWNEPEELLCSTKHDTNINTSISDNFSCLRFIH